MTKNVSSYESKSIDNINHILNVFENLKVCNGLTNNDYHKVKNTFSPDKCVESFGRFRHAQCNKIVSNEIG